MKIKKNIFLILTVFILFNYSYSQLPTAEAPKLEFANKHSIIFQVGQKLMFRQTCTNLVDTIVTNGEIIFSHSYINQIPCYQSIYLKDTVLISQMIEINGKKNIKQFWSAINPYFKEYSASQNKKRLIYYSNGIYDDKRIAYILVLNANSKLTFIIQLSS